MKPARPFLAISLSLFVSACASPHLSGDHLAETRMTKAGKVLVDDAGMTLYTYDKDGPGASSCTGMCAIAWPPAIAGQGAQARNGFSVITRPNGSRQWAYEGHPLYGYFGDSEPGDVSGNDKDGVWHVVHAK